MPWDDWKGHISTVFNLQTAQRELVLCVSPLIGLSSTELYGAQANILVLISTSGNYCLKSQ